jgi:hypothetical protein
MLLYYIEGPPSYGEIFAATTLELHSSDVLLEEAVIALLATRLARSTGMNVFSLEGDALLVIFAVNQPSLFAFWRFASIIYDISVDSFPF